MRIKWKIKKDVEFKGDVTRYVAEVRGINNIEKFLNPPSEVVHSPLLLKNIKQAIKRTQEAITKNEKIMVVADVDFDGVASTVIMMDYLGRLTSNLTYTYHQRSKGHGLTYDNIPEDVDLLIVLDSSSSEVDECLRLSKLMDIIIIDHHNLEVADNPHCILVNPVQKGCEYPNKETCATLLVHKFVEVLDYHYKKVNIDNYLDLVGAGLLADVISMSVLENRYYVKRALEKIHNTGLLSLIHEKRLNHNNLNATDFAYSINPIISTVTRNDEIEKAFSLLFEKDFFKAREKSRYLINENEERKKKQRQLTGDYEKLLDLNKIGFVISKDATKNYNGLVAGQLAEKYKRPIMVLRNNGEYYQGSARSYNNFDLQKFVKESNLIDYAAGHSAAFGFSIKAENWEKFKQYVNDNIDEKLFEPVIEYDIELTEDELSWKIVNIFTNFDTIWGSNSPKITVKLTDVFVEDKELFPKGKEEHLKIKTDKMDIMKFYDKDYAGDVDSWDDISVIGSVGVNEWRGERRIQFYVEDYVKN